MALFGSKKRVLLLGNEGVTLFGPAGGIEREGFFPWNAPGFDAQLTAALSQRHSGSAVTVLFDGADQTYRREENIPKLSAFDRPRYIGRRLEQVFPNIAIKGAFEVPAVKGKTPLSYLFAAVPETENIDRVSNILFEAGVPIAGFGLLPVESAKMVSAMANKVFAGRLNPSRWAVLVAQHETGGLRQVVIKDGRLALTRMTPAPDAGAHGAAWVEDVVNEFRSTLTYISRFGYTPDDGLDVMIVCGNAEKSIFEQYQLPVTNLRCMGAGEALTALGLRGRGVGERHYGDVVYAGWASSHPLVSPLDVPSLKAVMVPRQMAGYATMALGAVVLGLAGLCAMTYSDYLPLQDQIATKLQLKSRMASEYAEQEKVVAALPVAPVQVRRTLAVQGVMEAGTVKITPVLISLRDNLPEDMKVLELSFTHDPNGILRRPEPAPAAANVPRGRGTTAPTAHPNGLLMIKLRFSLPNEVSLEAKVARAEALLESLRAAYPDYVVDLRSQFGRISRTGQFEGVAGSDASSRVVKGSEDYAEIDIQGVPL